MPLRSRPALARILPFGVYILCLVGESKLSALFDARWLYSAQVLVASGLLVYLWPVYDELRRPSAARTADWILGAVVGAIVFVLWINLDFSWAQFGEGRGVAAVLTGGTAIAGLAVRMFGVVVLVPIMEELFWRSFLMRWLDNADFRAVAPAAVSGRSLLLASAVFGLEHHLWLAGIVAGLALGWLYRRTGNLWVAVLAHVVTNALLELWVVRTGSWNLL